MMLREACALHRMEAPYTHSTLPPQHGCLREACALPPSTDLPPQTYACLEPSQTSKLLKPSPSLLIRHAHPICVVVRSCTRHVF